MQILEDILTNNPPSEYINEYCPCSQALFIDIETTGLKKETTSLYLIGCGYYKGNDFYTKLFFGEDESEELLILNAFLDFLKGFSHLFHFNGNKFDIPYLKYKADLYSLGDIFEKITQVDVYNLIKPLRYLLFPQSMRQKVVEDFLSVEREDKFNGGELIEVYKHYVKSHDDDDFKALITHNKEDVIGMHKIMPILNYLAFSGPDLHFEKYEINEYEDYTKETKKEVLLYYRHTFTIPKSFVSKTNTMYIKVSAGDNTVIIRLPIIEDSMKMYYDNYRDYYYLPERDCSIIKELCSGLTKGSYQKATKENCYTKVEGCFVKQPGKIFSPSFKVSYKDKAHYFRFPDDFNEDKRNEFGNELIKVFFHTKRPCQ